MAEKTIGSILREAREAWELQYTETGAYDQSWRTACDEAAASAVWDQAVEACAQKADYWGNGGFVVQEEPGRNRYNLRDLQAYTNVAGRGIAEDIRALKCAASNGDNNGRRHAHLTKIEIYEILKSK